MYKVFLLFVSVFLSIQLRLSISSILFILREQILTYSCYSFRDKTRVLYLTQILEIHIYLSQLVSVPFHVIMKPG